MSSCGGGGGNGSGVAIEELPANLLPLADGGEDIQSSDMTTVTFDGAGSADPDGRVVSFKWAQVDNGAPRLTLSGQDGPQLTVEVPDLTEKTAFAFELTVADDLGDESTDTVGLEVLDTNCEDIVDGIARTGGFTTTAAGDFLPRCGSEVYIANQVLNQVELINVHTGQLLASYPLSAAPTDLEYETHTGKLYVALDGVAFYAVIDKNNDTLDYVQTPDTVSQIDADHQGSLYFALGSDRYYKEVYKIDANRVASGPWPIAGTAIAYNSRTNQVLAGNFGLIPASIYRYGFDEMGELIELEALRTEGSNGQDLALSNDGESFALAAGGGNGNGYTIFDYDAENFSVVHGEWATGPYPSGVAYSPDDSLVAASNYSQLLLFNRYSHAELARIDIPYCDYSRVTKVSFSSGTKLAFAKQECGFRGDTVKIYYFKVPSGEALAPRS